LEYLKAEALFTGQLELLDTGTGCWWGAISQYWISFLRPGQVQSAGGDALKKLYTSKKLPFMYLNLKKQDT
jgi:hypothetical protein